MASRDYPQQPSESTGPRLEESSARPEMLSSIEAFVRHVQGGPNCPIVHSLPHQSYSPCPRMSEECTVMAQSIFKDTFSFSLLDLSSPLYIYSWVNFFFTVSFFLLLYCCYCDQPTKYEWSFSTWI